MTWSLAAVSLELPVMSFCFRPYLKKKPRDIGRPFPLVRLLILSMEMNSGIRRSIVLAASWSVRRSATACLRLTPSSPFISVSANTVAYTGIFLGNSVSWGDYSSKAMSAHRQWRSYLSVWLKEYIPHRNRTGIQIRVRASRITKWFTRVTLSTTACECGRALLGQVITMVLLAQLT